MKKKIVKNRKNLPNNLLFRLLLPVFLLATMAIGFEVYAQDKSETTIGLTCSKNADGKRNALALIKARNKAGKFAPAKNVRINFYVLHENNQQLISSANTDIKGLAIMPLQPDLPTDGDKFVTIFAKIENEPLYENAEEKVHYKDATLTLKLNQQDTNRTVTALVMEMGKDGKETPVKDVAVKFYIQRLFGNMPASEENAITTDEKGEAAFSFPKSIPGNTTGGVNLLAKIEDNEQYGSVENKAAATWGTVLQTENDPFPRALWEPSAPWPLVMVFVILFGGVWSTYCYLIYLLVRIKKDGKE